MTDLESRIRAALGADPDSSRYGSDLVSWVAELLDSLPARETAIAEAVRRECLRHVYGPSSREYIEHLDLTTVIVEAKGDKR